MAALLILLPDHKLLDEVSPRMIVPAPTGGSELHGFEGWNIARIGAEFGAEKHFVPQGAVERRGW